ncbi:DNA repair protein RecO (recombination protein O) [Dysgonomonadaceae bacterium PH5-43]|nr:DNA repair protein RecO (recombination protein O) [Dysgonomonadaceae bacterium PH5-43]
MLHKTKGIILYKNDYNDTYSILHVYTEEFGIVSYLTSRSKGKKTKLSRSLFHQMAVLDLEVEHKNNREIQRLKEAKVHISFSFMLDNPIKSSICIFLAEFINKVVKESHSNKLLFDYVVQSLQVLDLLEKDYANFHLVFLIRLSQFLGFYPDATTYNKGMFFDMQNGVFTHYKPTYSYFLNPDESANFYNLLRMDYNNMSKFKLSGKERNEIIKRILDYYRLHLTNFSEIKSLEILREVFG